MKIVNKLKSKSLDYMKFLREDIQENFILLEAGQGKNLNGNMFALLREINLNPKWANMVAIFVVTEDTYNQAKERFSYYGYNTRLVIRGSKEYMKYLATAKYLATDNSFPPYFNKRKEQVYLNTWHGTPLKTLGKSDIENATSLANIQKNYLMSDYALFPNKFTRDVFMHDYMLANLFSNKVLLCDYPRNSAFLRREESAKLRSKLHLDNFQLIAYMPTWRGGNRTADAAEQKEILHNYFSKIDKKLNNNQIFYVNLHFLVGNVMDYSKYKHIRPFPSEYETYDFLSICDQLVTDYSSVFFDFAITKRKITLFTYDLDEYMAERGTYFPITNLPFPIHNDVDGLIKEINSPINYDMESFLHTYCMYQNVNNPEKILDLMINGKSDLVIEDGENNGKENVLVYAGNLKNKQLNALLYDYLIDYSQKYQKENVILVFRGKITKTVTEFLKTIPHNINYLALVNKYELTILDKIKSILSMRINLCSKLFDKSLVNAYTKEWNRLFYHINPKKFIYYSGKPEYMYRMGAQSKAKLIAHLQNNVVVGLQNYGSKFSNMKTYLNMYYDEVISHESDNVMGLYDEENKKTCYNRSLKIGNICARQRNRRSGITYSAIAVAKKIFPFAYDDLKIKVGDTVVTSKVKKICSVFGYDIIRYSFCMDELSILNLGIQNKLYIYYADESGYGLEKGIRYNIFHRKKGKNKHKKLYSIPQYETVAYIRETAKNTIYLTVRKQNVTDLFKERVKLFFAYYLSKIMVTKKIILLFEKESSRYEESASVLYEKLMDQGYQSAYFIIDKSYPYLSNIKEKYRHNLIYKYSFKHYLYFFKSNTFIGSEALVHAIDLRIINHYALKKLASKKLDYVFLQHGVMYMISLDSESRKFFKPKKTDGKFRVVTSSEEEARHFIELGKYLPEYIYISGLPKYDRNILNDGADRIVIMPTWRPWEYNEARYDFSSTAYYKMICRIFDAIPEEYHEKITILPHPLFFDAVKDADFKLKKYLDVTSKYDDILKETKVLITDYSSIAYDAFYRGSNVIFYWEEKNQCLENYGPSTKLMLNENNVYGDICYSKEDLKNVFNRNYLEKQNSKFIKNYTNLVQYHDGKNTDRLISFLKEDEII